MIPQLEIFLYFRVLGVIYKYLEAVHKMAGGTPTKILSLYKTMLRESQKFVDKNYRSYAIRRVRDGFKEGAKETDQSKIQENILKAKDDLIIIKRQSTISHLFDVSYK